MFVARERFITGKQYVRDGDESESLVHYRFGGIANDLSPRFPPENSG